MAREFYTAVDLHGNPLKHVPLPVDGTDAANKDYVDAHAGSGGGVDGLTEAEIDALFLKPSEILGGTNVTVTESAGAVTISSDHTHPFVNTSRWNYMDVTSMVNPNTGNIRGDTLPGTPTNNLAIHSISATGIDKTDVLLALAEGDLIVVQEDLARENWVRFTVDGPVINNGSWFQIPVQQSAVGGTELVRNDDVLISFTYGTGGGGGTGGGLTEAEADALFLKPSEIIAGTNVTVTPEPDGSVTIASTGGGGGGTTDGLAYAATLAAGMTATVTHGLGTKDVSVTVYRSDGVEVLVPNVRISTSAVRLDSGVDLAGHRIVVFANGGLGAGSAAVVQVQDTPSIDASVPVDGSPLTTEAVSTTPITVTTTPTVVLT